MFVAGVSGAFLAAAVAIYFGFVADLKWAFAIGVLPVTLMFLGDLTPFQTASVVVSLPLIPVGVLMAVSLVRSLREDQAEAG